MRERSPKVVSFFEELILVSGVEELPEIFGSFFIFFCFGGGEGKGERVGEEGGGRKKERGKQTDILL